MSSDFLEWVRISQELSPEIEQMLEIDGLADELKRYKENPETVSQLSMRDISAGDVVSICGLVISLVAFVDQISSGRTMKESSREEVIERLILKLSDTDELTPEMKRQLAEKLIDKLGK